MDPVGVAKRLLLREDGQALAEYALIITLIALVCVAALTLLGGNISTFFSGFAGSF